MSRPDIVKLHGSACGACTTEARKVVAIEAHGGQKWMSFREDWLKRLALRFRASRRCCESAERFQALWTKSDRF